MREVTNPHVHARHRSTRPNTWTQLYYSTIPATTDRGVRSCSRHSPWWASREGVLFSYSKTKPFSKEGIGDLVRDRGFDPHPLLNTPPHGVEDPLPRHVRRWVHDKGVHAAGRGHDCGVQDRQTLRVCNRSAGARFPSCRRALRSSPHAKIKYDGADEQTSTQSTTRTSVWDQEYLFSVRDRQFISPVRIELWSALSFIGATEIYLSDKGVSAGRHRDEWFTMSDTDNERLHGCEVRMEWVWR